MDSTPIAADGPPFLDFLSIRPAAAFRRVNGNRCLAYLPFTGSRIRSKTGRAYAMEPRIDNQLPKLISSPESISRPLSDGAAADILAW